MLQEGRVPSYARMYGGFPLMEAHLCDDVSALLLCHVDFSDRASRAIEAACARAKSKFSDLVQVS